ncbi:MAG: nuclear transport factor 2 family protein [Chloroflexi bacterium]|nr:nuclear transport factor 2 family protein [Chloroflexota bacterium]
MHPNEQLIHTFYTSFQKRDAAGMIACYHPDILFSDPVFTHLQGARAGAMWQMLCARGKDLTLTFTNVRADDRAGSAHWEATYSFSQTGRKVLNVIDATFEFRDGKIVRHADSFDLWKWAGMALGAPGALLGWSPPMQAAIRKTASRGLEAFIQKQGAQTNA